MIETTLAGRIDIALYHFAAVGLSAIVAASGHSARSAWSNDSRPRPVIYSDLDLEKLVKVVGDHAAVRARDDSWLRQVVRGGPRDGAGLLTVRSKAIPADQWAAIHQQRQGVRRSHVIDALDERLIGALGEPAWWLLDTQGRSADDGGSRWEMKTRNRGEEFIVHRLAPLAFAVAGRTPQQIAAGLAGTAIVDETGSRVGSRTATGLNTPGPVDSAVAWCALWALHVMPTVARRAAVSQSACVWPRRGTHPRSAAVPVFTDPVTPRRFAEICADQRLEAAWRAIDTVETDADQPLRAQTARAWLVEQGVRAIAHFPILKTGSPSAPERQLLAGEVFVLVDAGW